MGLKDCSGFPLFLARNKPSEDRPDPQHYRYRYSIPMIYKSLKMAFLIPVLYLFIVKTIKLLLFGHFAQVKPQLRIRGLIQNLEFRIRTPDPEKVSNLQL
jgi:hypothetical protein